MIKKIIVAVSFFLPVLCAGQVTVSVQLPPAGMIQKDQLWNLVVVNNNKTTLEVMVSLDLQDAVTGQTVLSAVGRSFLLAKGAKIIGIRDIQPVLYNFQSSDFTGKFIPLGSYIACYKVFRNGEKGPEPLGEECVRTNISSLSPPLLASPSDKATVETVYPSFSWVPPSPIDMFSSLSYDIAVAEIAPGQSPTEAILYNTPVYTSHNLKVPYMNYPSGFSKLRQGQQYAWQVTARNGLNYAAQTEVWSFIPKPADSTQPAISFAGYLVLSSDATQAGMNYITDQELFVKYYSFDKGQETVVRFYAAGKQLVAAEKQTIIYGNNFLHFKLDTRFRKGEIYSIEVTDKEKNIYTTRFSIK
jgi:hypothetical protein